MAPRASLILAAFGLVVAPGDALAGISFVAATSNVTSTASIAIPRPAGLAAGDVMVASIAGAGSSALNAPSGWTPVLDTTSGTAERHVSWIKVAGASESSSYTFTLTVSRRATGGIVAYRGVNTTVPVDAAGDANGASGNATAPAVLTTADGDELIVTASTARSTTYTAATGTVERFDRSTTGMTEELADQAQPLAGTIGPWTVRPAASASRWAANTIALRDAAAGQLSVTAAAVPPFAADLNTGDHTPTYDLPITVTDTRDGADGGLGWHLQLTSTQFTDAAAHTLDRGASSVTGVSAACGPGGGTCVAPDATINYSVAVPADAAPPSAITIANAATGTGLGIIDLTATVAVVVPQNAYEGDYTSTLTLSVATGP